MKNEDEKGCYTMLLTDSKWRIPKTSGHLYWSQTPGGPNLARPVTRFDKAVQRDGPFWIQDKFQTGWCLSQAPREEETVRSNTQISECLHWCQQWAPQKTGPGTSGSCVASRRRNLKPWAVDRIFVTTNGSKLLRRKKCTLQWLPVVSMMSREISRWDSNCNDSSCTSDDFKTWSQFTRFCISWLRDEQYFPGFVSHIRLFVMLNHDGFHKICFILRIFILTKGGRLFFLHGQHFNSQTKNRQWNCQKRQ